jgi:hypothetical protein
MTYIRSLLLCLLAALVLTPALHASGPTFWTTATAADFLEGTSDGVFVSLNGTVTAGPQLTNRLTSTPAQIWSLATGGDGSIWAGTGGDGRVIRLVAGQPERTVLDSGESNVFALAVSGSRVYAATGPDGKVYAIESDGTSRPFFDPTEKYIWALAVDASGRLWVGAGNPAVIYRVDASGASTVVYRPPAAHVVSLAHDASGRMLAGTESPGRLYRFDAADHGFVVLDSGATELRAIAVDARGVVYAAATVRGDDSGGGETPSVAAALGASSSTTPAPAASSSSTSGTARATSSASTASVRQSELFRIDPNGTWETIWTTPDAIYDVNVVSDGVLVATGPAGRLYKVSPNRDVSLLTGVDAKQITRFVPSGRPESPVAFATANPGRVMLMGAGEQSPAVYDSPVRDTESASTWGLIRWQASGALALRTRSGNTDEPDDSWSEWSAPYTHAEGEAITSPPARFLQWRAVFTKTPTASATALTSVTVAYLTTNSRPHFSSLTVYPPGVVFQRPYVSDESAIAGLDQSVADARRAPGDPGPATPAPGRRMFQRGLQTISWKADDDDDGDRLTYAIEYRREGTDVWRELKSGITDSMYVWDTTSAVDGRYIVRVRASDSPSNAPERALTGERESDPIDVDNTPPTLTTEVTRQGSTARLLIRAHDARSPIRAVECSVNGGPWQLLYPLDGLADSPDERYELPLASATDVGRIVVRATDLLQNTMSQPATASPQAQ